MIIHNRNIREKEHFNRLVRSSKTSWWGNETYAGQKRQDRRFILLQSLLPTQKKLKILELGCALGEFTKRLTRNKNYNIIAVDISPGVIKKAMQNNLNKVIFEIADIYRLPYKEGSFDLVCGNAILHHLDLKLALPEIKRVLKKDGQIIFFEPNMLNPEVFLEKNIKFIGKLTQNSPDETAFIRQRLFKTLKMYGFLNIKIILFDFLHPLIPKTFVSLFAKISQILENTPVVKEFSGSLLITAKK